jgi:hypothetical protein
MMTVEKDIDQIIKALDMAKELAEAVIEMHKADKEYGCGFYGTDRWLAAYKRTLELVAADVSKS